MRKALLEPGVLYGYATSRGEYRNPVPVIVLDTSQLYTCNYNRYHGSYTYRHSTVTTPSRGHGVFGDAHGYLVLIADTRRVGLDFDDQISAMNRLYAQIQREVSAGATLAAVVNALVNHPEHPISEHNVLIDVINNRHIGDTWEVDKAAADAVRKARDERWKAENERSKQARQVAEDLREKLNGLGYTDAGLYNEPNAVEARVSLSAEVLGDLLRRVREAEALAERADVEQS